MTIAIRPTTADDIAAAAAVLEDGRRALRERRIPQWQGTYPNSDDLTADMAAGTGFVALEEGDVVGVLAFLTDPERDYEAVPGIWLTQPTAAGGDAAYACIHRCAVAARAARRGVMSALFEAMEERARHLGRTSMRVDTHERNRAMRAFLDKRGYTECGRVVITDAGTGSDEPDPVRIGYEKLL